MVKWITYGDESLLSEYRCELFNKRGIFTALRCFSVSEGTWWSHARYPERETPKNFNIPETETRRPAFWAASVFSVTSR